MLCPVCKEFMVVLELEQVEIDYCTSCEGIWLDSGELELLLENEAERAKLLKSLQEAPGHAEKKHRCPVCNKKMVKVYVGDDKKILIDKCKKDHGLWFDKGELRSVIELGSKESKIVSLLKEMFEYQISTNEKRRK